MMYRAIVIGTSYGGLEALNMILPELKKDFPVPVVIVLHIGEHSNDIFIRHLNAICELEVKEAEANEPILPGFVYFAPPGYHLQIEDDYSFSLSAEKKLNFSRPSIDILFETAAWAYKNQLIGIVLTGANSDGTNGLKTIKHFGGKTIIQNPCKATSPVMPRFALKAVQPDLKLNLEEIADSLYQLVRTK
ncbi:chemotaxis protein CheB [Maribellus luteus]|uniref:protein-glutamate methylesterase n=2 Tax=Maribellus luteus TaxID=2305463 RepID=A0A399SV88_9BACT|nr:chemotaxis protein CheB [Maribellus luteus]